MGNFNRDDRRPGGGFNRGGGNRSFGGGRGFDRRDNGPRPMYPAVCGECGDNCEVPFRPTGARPVFCSNCFGKQQENGDSGRSNRFENAGEDKKYFDSRQMHDTVCSKCGKPCQVPFRPEPGKSAFCENCYQKGGSKNVNANEVAEQLKMLNAKIDRLVSALVPGAAKENKAADKKKDAAEKVATAPETPAEKKAKTKTKAKAAPKKAAAKKKKS